jgi:hypothetical protein
MPVGSGALAGRGSAPGTSFLPSSGGGGGGGPFALKCDGTSSDAYVYKVLASDLDEFYLTFAIVLPSALISFIEAGNFSGEFYQLYDAADWSGGGSTFNTIEGLFLNETDAKWWTDSSSGGDFGTAPAGDTGICVQTHIKVSTNEETVQINGTPFSVTASLSSWGSLHAFQLGYRFTNADASEKVYIYDVRLGTTGMGSSDVFADDFSSGDLSLWDGSVGAASVVTSPYGAITACSGGGGGPSGLGVMLATIFSTEAA